MKILWTRESCKEEAQKYNSRNEFKKNNESAYKASLKNKWIDDIENQNCNEKIELQKDEYLSDLIK